MRHDLHGVSQAGLEAAHEVLPRLASGVIQRGTKDAVVRPV